MRTVTVELPAKKAVGKDRSGIESRVHHPAGGPMAGVDDGAVPGMGGGVFDPRNSGWPAGAIISYSIRAVIGKCRKRRSRGRSPDGALLSDNPSRVFACIPQAENWRRLSAVPAESRRVRSWLSGQGGPSHSRASNGTSGQAGKLRHKVFPMNRRLLFMRLVRPSRWEASDWRRP